MCIHTFSRVTLEFVIWSIIQLAHLGTAKDGYVSSSRWWRWRHRCPVFSGYPPLYRSTGSTELRGVSTMRWASHQAIVKNRDLIKRLDTDAVILSLCLIIECSILFTQRISTFLCVIIAKEKKKALVKYGYFVICGVKPHVSSSLSIIIREKWCSLIVQFKPST